MKMLLLRQGRAESFLGPSMCRCLSRTWPASFQGVPKKLRRWAQGDDLSRGDLTYLPPEEKPPKHQLRQRDGLRRVQQSSPSHGSRQPQEQTGLSVPKFAPLNTAQPAAPPQQGLNPLVK